MRTIENEFRKVKRREVAHHIGFSNSLKGPFTLRDGKHLEGLEQKPDVNHLHSLRITTVTLVKRTMEQSEKKSKSRK